MSESRVKPGDVLGDKYRVERVLGTGGMGMVVSAQHIELGQRVALKFMLKEAMDSPVQEERFLREARAASQLKSPHTARVLDVGRLANGEPYMVMEYLEGQDLDDLLDFERRLPEHVAVDYVLQVSEALAEAHALGLIHRDIKLKNLFLTKTVDGRPFVKVLDFGLAKTIGIGGDISLTATSAVFGSPQYMSPEQMRSAKDVDARSDIWSIGVCLYELVTGKLPFDAPGLAEICAMVLKDPLPLPSTILPSISPALEAIVVRCLEKDPARRYSSVAELAFDLDPLSTAERSGPRLLQVMETARRNEALAATPSIRPVAATTAATLDAWDTADRPTPGRKLTTLHVAALAVFCGLATLGVVATAIAFHDGGAVVRSTASTPSTASPPPPPSDVPLPTAPASEATNQADREPAPAAASASVHSRGVVIRPPVQGRAGAGATRGQASRAAAPATPTGTRKDGTRKEGLDRL